MALATYHSLQLDTESLKAKLQPQLLSTGAGSRRCGANREGLAPFLGLSGLVSALGQRHGFQSQTPAPLEILMLEAIYCSRPTCGAVVLQICLGLALFEVTAMHVGSMVA